MVTSEIMDWCTSLLMDELLLSSSMLLLAVSPEEEGLGLDQFHVDEHRRKGSGLIL